MFVDNRNNFICCKCEFYNKKNDCCKISEVTACKDLKDYVKRLKERSKER